MNQNVTLNRRCFLRGLTAATFTFPWINRLGAATSSDLLRHASFGASGMAEADLGAILDTQLARLIAVADVDLPRAEALKKKHPNIRIYQDWRVLLDKEARNIDSVNVSTPDHMHAPIMMAALQLGKHVYGQKPLTHNVFEARQVARQARHAKVVTQMGIQIHSNVEYRTTVKLIQDLAIGKVKEVHSWSGKKWGDPDPVPDRSDPVPAGLDWNGWLGVAQERPYLQGYYHPGNWRKRLDFGTGTFGDMGCHIYDPVFKALALTAPLTLRSEGGAPTPSNWGVNAIIHYEFPGTAFTDGDRVRVTWYDGDMRPPRDIRDLVKVDQFPDQGSLFMGTKGVLLLPHIGMPQLFPEDQFDAYKIPTLSNLNHWQLFVEACRGHGTTSANFDYAGALTETVLLGGVAARFPQQLLEWDAAALRFKNKPEADRFLRREYRQGWEPKWA
jgi:predicted dehydrogenase